MDTIEEARKVAERYCAAWAADDLTGKDAAIAALLAVGAKAPRKLIGVDDILAGPGSAVVVTREHLHVDNDEVEITRVLRFRIADDRFQECWLYEHDQALIDRAWS